MAEQKAEGLGAEAFRFSHIDPEVPTIEKVSPEELAARRAASCGCGCGCGGAGGGGGGGGSGRAVAQPVKA